MKTVLISIILACTAFQSHGGAVDVLATSQNNIMIVKMTKVNGAPVMALYQTTNPKACRPSFIPGSVLAETPAVQNDNGMTKIVMTLGSSVVCGPEAHMQKLSKEAGSTAYVSYHYLKSLVEAMAKQNSALGSYLNAHPGVLDTENVEIHFLYQHYSPGAADSKLVTFTVPFYNLNEGEFGIFHMSPLDPIK